MSTLSILSLLGRLPNLIVILAGLVAAVVFWRKAGLSALWAVAGFGILLLLHLFGWVQPWIIEGLYRSMGTNLSIVAVAINIVTSLIGAVAVACLVVSLIVAWQNRP